MAKRRRKTNNKEKAAKRPCPLESAGVVEINYKDIELLRQFITEKGKIIPRRITGLSSKSQKMLTHSIKLARNASLLSFAEGYVPQHEQAQEQDTRPPRRD